MFSWKIYEFFRSSHRMFYEKAVFKNIHRNVADQQLYSKKISIQVISSEYCEIFKNNLFEEHLQTAPSDFL